MHIQSTPYSILFCGARVVRQVHSPEILSFNRMTMLSGLSVNLTGKLEKVLRTDLNERFLSDIIRRQWTIFSHIIRTQGDWDGITSIKSLSISPSRTLRLQL